MGTRLSAKREQAAHTVTARRDGKPLEGIEVEHLALIWLTLDGPMIEVRVDNCEIAEMWFESARAWAKRSGVATNEPGYLCDWDGKPVVVRTSR